MRISALLLLGYLLGGINLSIPLTRLLYGQDIRKVGSGNPGTANMLHSFGAAPAAAVLIFDICKVFLPVRLLSVHAENGLWLPVFVGLAGIAGHIWSVFLHFHGGKGVACAFGAALALCPQCAVILLGICAVLLFGTRSVSISAVAASAYAIPVFLSFALSDGMKVLPYLVFSLGLFALLYVRHLPQLRRKHIQR